MATARGHTGGGGQGSSSGLLSHLGSLCPKSLGPRGRVYSFIPQTSPATHQSLPGRAWARAVATMGLSRGGHGWEPQEAGIRALRSLRFSVPRFPA